MNLFEIFLFSFQLGFCLMCFASGGIAYYDLRTSPYKDEIQKNLDLVKIKSIVIFGFTGLTLTFINLLILTTN